MKEQILSHLLSEHFSWHKSRISLFSQMVFSLIRTCNVRLKDLSRYISREADSASNIRRVQRFFQYQDIDFFSLFQFIFSILPQTSQMIFSLDRTNWTFGKIEINFLVLARVIGKTAVPIFWILLPKKGNSSQNERIHMLKKVIKTISGPGCCLLADREFIGQSWLEWLEKNNISYVIRIRENTLIQHKNGGMVPLSFVCHDLKVGQTAQWNSRVFEKKRHVSVLRLKTQELMAVISHTHAGQQALDLYKKRWGIECLFKSMKTSGFHLENTRLNQRDRLSKLMAVVAVAAVIILKAGLLKSKDKPIPIKNHGRPLYSIFTYGIVWIQSLIDKKPWKTFKAFLKKLFQEKLIYIH
jgi:hypothetical protein